MNINITRIISILTFSMFLTFMTVSNANADVKKGQKYYLKIFKKKLGMNGTKFAASHTVAEWNILFNNNAELFIKEYSKSTPKLSKFLNGKKFKKKYMLHIKDFALEYANDTGNVPSCG
jgi:hypothetical protein